MMEVGTIRALRGANVWGRGTALQLTVRLAEGEQGKTLASLGLVAALRKRCPELVSAETEKWTLPVLLERLGRHLQLSAGSDSSMSRTEPRANRDFIVVVGYREEAVGRKALDGARALIEALRADQPFDLAGFLAELRSLDEEIRLGPSTGAIARAAWARGIPVRRLNDGSLAVLGYGAKQRRILAAETDRTSAIGEAIAQDKTMTKDVLHAVGVPVPEGRIAKDAPDAWAVARSLQGAVVVKPVDGNHGRGVAVGLTTRAQVEEAFEAALKEGSQVLVERCAEGFDHRILVIGGKVVAAARRDVPMVVGDGQRTIAELVEQENQNPLRGEGHAMSLSKLKLDGIGLNVLSRQGLGPQSVPAPGVRVILRRAANISTGGTATDVTDELHPEVIARAEDAAQAVGLDIAGIDLICKTVTEPLETQRGVVVEVNAAPGLRMHLEPTVGKPRPVGEAIVNSLFEPGNDGRVPIVAVTGNNGKTTSARLIAALMRMKYKAVGLTSTDGVYVNDDRIDTGDCSGPKSARNVLMHPEVDAAVLETARGGILREGLGFESCDVAVVTNIGVGDHLGLGGIETVEQLARVKRVVVENVSTKGSAVLNGADPLVVAMAAHCPGSVIFFARDPSTPALKRHRAAGGRTISVDRQGWIVATIGEWERRLVDVRDVPVTRGGTIPFQIENVLAAVGAGWAVDLPWELLQEGILGFGNDAQRTPGRFNLFEHRGATILADYGHNIDALQALMGAVERLPGERRKVIFCSAGDRRDEDIIHHTQILGDAFDEVILFEDACNRGRAEGELIALMRRGLEGRKRVREVREIRGEFAAIDAALAGLKSGDLILLLLDQVDESLAYLKGRLAEGAVA